MSTPPPTASAAPAKSGGLKAHLPFVVALLAGLVVGGGAGAFVVGPAMASGIAPGGAAAAAASHAGDDAAEGAEDAAGTDGEAAAEEGAEEGAEEEGSAPKGGEALAHTIDNLVLNPAASGGTRFLLLTVTFEVRNASTLDKMKARDAELRDAVLVSLGTKTVEELADMAKRDQLKADLKAAATKLFKPGAVRRVYFPQFVIQ